MAKRPAKAAAEPKGAGGGGGGGGEARSSPRVVLLIGPELFLHAEHTERIRESLSREHGRVGVFAFDGATAQAAEVLDECRTFGLMEPHKLVVLDSLDQFLKVGGKGEAGGGGEESDDDGDEPGASRHRELLERYLASPCDGATLLLRSAKGFTLGKLKAAIESVGAIVRCSLIDPDNDRGPTGKALGKEAASRLETQRATEWAVGRAKEAHNAILPPDAAVLLVERIGPHLSHLDSELAKLALNAATVDRSKPGTITTRHVSDMVGRSREEEVWVIQSALLSGDAGEALRSVRDAIDVSRHHPVLISWACVDLARKLHGASRALAGGMNEWQIKGALRLWGDSAGPIVAAARRVNPAAAAGLLKEAVEADMRQKSGSDPERSLESLALRFASV